MHRHGTEQSTAAVCSVDLVSYAARDVCGRSFKVLLMFLVFHTRDAALGRNSVERINVHACNTELVFLSN